MLNYFFTIFNDPLSDRTGTSCFHDGKLCQCNLGVSSYGCSLVVFYIFISTTACLYAIYLLKFLVQLYPSCRSSCQPRVSRVTSLTTTVSPGLVTAKSLSQFLIFYLPVFIRFLRPYLMVHCGCRHPQSSDFP